MIGQKETADKADFKCILDKAMTLGASYADARYQVQDSENISVENKTLKSYSSRRLSGFGIRVVVNGAIGYASSNNASEENLQKTLENSIKAAKSIGKRGKPFDFSEVNVAHVSSPFKVDPFEVSPEEKVSIVLEANKAAWIGDEIKNVITKMSFVEGSGNLQQALDGLNT